MGDVEQRLADLKKMRDKGLVTESVYEAQQKEILSGSSAESDDQSKNATFLDPKKNFRILLKVATFAAVVLAGIWVVYHVVGRDGKDSISQFAAQTGIGKQVIPWTDRADTAARKLLEKNKAQIANAIQAITHPTGKSPEMNDIAISKLPDRILVNLKVGWKGGIIGGDYVTLVAWEIGEQGHLGAKVTMDTSVTGVDAKNNELLIDYFRTKVYPAFVTDVGG